MVPSEIESKGTEQQIKHAVWLAEVAAALFKPGQGAVTLLVDFGGPSTSRKYDRVWELGGCVPADSFPYSSRAGHHYLLQDR